MKNDLPPNGAEIDLSKFELGANYDTPSLSVLNPDPNMYYFIASRNSQAGSEAGTVGHCKTMGYVESKKECSGITDDLCLMEIPLVVRQAREKSRMEKQHRLVSSFGDIPEGMIKLPGTEHSVQEVRLKD